MKKLIPILLCALLLISCNGSVESDEPAETSFTPTKDNVIWQADDSYDALNAFWDNGTWMSRGTYGEIEILGILNEIMTESGDQRIAVQIEMFSTDENIGLDSVFKNLPEGYADTYGEDWGGWPYPVYFLTAEDIKALSCEPNAKVAVASISYEDYQLYKKSSNTPVETTAPETSFTPTKDNVVWQESTGSLTPLLSNQNPYLDFNGTYGEVEILGELEEIMSKAGDQRIAVQMDMETDNENIKFESVFKNLPEGYADKYHVDGKWTFPVYFLTVEDINALYCDPEAKVAITSIPYESYLMYEENAKNPTESATTTATKTTAPETSFVPTEDSVLWGNEKDYNALSGGGDNFGRYTDYDEVPRGEIIFRGSLKDLMAEAGERRIAVMFDFQPDDGIKFETVFKNLPEGYAEKYHVDGNWIWPVYFLTVEDINKLYCDPATKIAVSSVMYEEYLEYEYLAKHTYPPDQ